MPVPGSCGAKGIPEPWAITLQEGICDLTRGFK